ncbi:MAG: ATP-dependent helicase [Cellulomonas sp.]
MNPGPSSHALLRLVRPRLLDPVGAGVASADERAVSIRAADGAGARLLLDPDQQAVVSRVAAGRDRALLVLGAPGTGKTTVVVECVAATVARGDLAPQDVLVLAASRRSAADLRDRLSARLQLTSGQAMVRTASSAAFAVLRARSGLLGEPAPTLISGPEQDLLLAELLAGHAEGDGVPVVWPAGVPLDALGLRAFRDELRDLLMRAAERGLTPVDLAELGESHSRPAWVAAAVVYQEYLDVTVLRAATPDVGARYDPAVVVEEAAEALLAWDDEVAGAPRPRWRLVVVDDHQESTAATARLLRVLADDGARLVLLADPDAAVQTFRGASPALVGRAEVDGAGPGELGAERLVLGTVWRHGARLREVVSEVATRVGAVGAVAHRRATSADVTDPDSTEPESTHRGAARVAILPSAAQEAAYVAHTLRAAHLEDGTPWDCMAVIARSGAQVTALRRSLAGASVPVTVSGSDVALRDEPAVRPLLEAVRCVLGAVGTGAEARGGLEAETAARLLCSPLGGLDAVGLRRVRRALRAEEIAGGGGRTSDALLVEALEDPARAASLPPAARRALLRLANVLVAGRAAAVAPTADAQTVLWALWDAAGLAPVWRRSALAGGTSGARADRDLDAVLALFRAAETFVDRMPQAPPGAFVDWVMSQDLPADTLAARAHREGVAVLTPAGAAGREWDVVVVAGVQEGVWPDLRLRDSVLGAQQLVELLAGREPDAGQLGAGARAEVLSDELRSFTVAISRARRTLLVTAVADTDAQPSPFCELVDPCDEDVDPRRAQAPSPLDLRGLVALLRSRIEQSVLDGAPDTRAAALLARLARNGVTGADPAGWHGLADTSSIAPLWGPDEKVPVSPSKVEAAATCALRWALEAAGGTAAANAGQSLGTLVHSIAQSHPQGTQVELAAELDRRWGELGLGTGWPAVVERRRAEAMVRRLAEYVGTAGRPIVVEGEFRLELDRAVVRGSADRIEIVAEGGPGEPPTVRVSDLKTGRQAPSPAQALENPQLGAYQLAVDAGAFDELPPGTRSAGAQLVFVSDVNKGPALRTQPALGPEDDGPSWARRLVEEVAGRMAASTFTATVNPLCPHCPVRRSCPVYAEGAQVVE